MRRSERRELLERVIELAEAVRSKGLDPFDVRVREFFQKLRELLPMLRSYEELFLDAQAVLGLSDVIQHQEEWVKHRSSVLYLDPLLIMLKVQALDSQELAEIFLRVWKPVVEVEVLSPGGLREALDYWTELSPLSERAKELEGGGKGVSAIGERELERWGVLEKEEFEKLLEKTRRELERTCGKEGKVSYWEFVKGPSYEQTVKRAWMVSFLVSYGYADLELDPLEEEITIRIRGERGQPEEVKSLPIAITKEWWRGRYAGRSGRAAA